MLLIPGIILTVIYSYGPMFGTVMAFQQYTPAKGFTGSPWIGMDNFTYLFQLPDFKNALRNTLFIAIMKIIFGLVAPLSVGLLLNEMRKMLIKRTIQTLIYLPHFLSWVIISGVLIDILSPSQGIVNDLLKAFGVQPVFFLGNNHWFPWVIILSDTWKEFGFGTIIYLAAMTGVNPSLYEAAAIDGAGRWKQTWHVTLPGIRPIVILLVTLSLGRVLDAGFDQIFNLYSPITYESGDVIDTLVYRLGLKQAQFSVAAAAGLFRSVVSLILISVSYYIAKRFANYRIF
ncbi:sugar ABC transporter permease (plasmid) [Paenibacillus rhizovicinus]|uniref:Sugar ABC transporter permease n=1 Tax=Paenibacillus rhizovicinus TaxID=2704463 RepID=A0A6C0PAL0_9BACL|nr:sugar ABC transporter permease [Paenibacillus rhizovicinus]